MNIIGKIFIKWSKYKKNLVLICYSYKSLIIQSQVSQKWIYKYNSENVCRIQLRLLFNLVKNYYNKYSDQTGTYFPSQWFIQAFQLKTL